MRNDGAAHNLCSAASLYRGEEAFEPKGSWFNKAITANVNSYDFVEDRFMIRTRSVAGKALC